MRYQQIKSIYILHNIMSLWVPHQSTCSKWYHMDALFGLMMHEEQEVWTSLLHTFFKEGLQKVSREIDGMID